MDTESDAASEEAAPDGDEALHPHLSAGPPHGPHYDWLHPNGNVYRVFRDKRVDGKRYWPESEENMDVVRHPVVPGTEWMEVWEAVFGHFLGHEYTAVNELIWDCVWKGPGEWEFSLFLGRRDLEARGDPVQATMDLSTGPPPPECLQPVWAAVEADLIRVRRGSTLLVATHMNGSEFLNPGPPEAGFFRRLVPVEARPGAMNPSVVHLGPFDEVWSLRDRYPLGAVLPRSWYEAATQPGGLPESHWHAFARDVLAVFVSVCDGDNWLVGHRRRRAQG